MFKKKEIPKSDLPIEEKKSKTTTMQDGLASIIKKKRKKKSKAGSDIEIKKDDDSVDIQRNLAEVYIDGDGQIPDLSKLEKMQRPVWKTALYVLIVVFSVLLIVGLLGFWFFVNADKDSFTNENISLKIETPITIVSGQEGDYYLIITNKEEVNVYNAKLELEYPENFEYISSVPEASGDENNTWDFSVLKVGETQKIELKGKVLGALKSNQTFAGVLSFKPANLNAFFKQESIVDVAVSSSVLGIEVNGPEKTLANREVEYVISYVNNSDEVMNDLQVVADYPDGFIFKSSEPATSEEVNNLWSIEKLDPEEEGEIKIRGDYSAIMSSDNYEFQTRLQINQGGDYYPQAMETFITEVVKDQLSVQLIINGSAEDAPINFDDLLVYTINYKNTGQEDLENVKISAVLDSGILDWGSLIDDNNGSWQQNKITWTGKKIPQLLKLGAGEEGEISWSIRVKDANVVGSSNVDNFSIESYVEAEAGQNQGLGESKVKSKSIVNSINSDLGVNAVARYYNEDNIALGAGSIAPVVGEKSIYNIKLSLTNNLHDIKDIMVVATLPKNVKFADRSNRSVGNLVYNESANKITWTISRLAKSASEASASFNVQIEPLDEDLGRILILVSDVDLKARDADTGADISKSIKAITTALNDPILGQVSGIVK